MHRFLSIIVITLVLSIPASADDRSPARVMMEETGFLDVYGGFDKILSTNLADILISVGALDQDDIPVLNEIVRATFEQDQMQLELETAFNNSLPPRQMKRFTAFYKSPPGQRILKSEMAASSGDVLAFQPGEKAYLLAELEKSPARKSLFLKMDQATNSSEYVATLATDSVVEILLGFASTNDRIRADILDLTKGVLKNIKVSLEKEAQLSILAENADVYRNNSDEDLRAYLAFLHSKDGRAIYQTEFAATMEIFQERCFLVGASMGKYKLQKKL